MFCGKLLKILIEFLAIQINVKGQKQMIESLIIWAPFIFGTCCGFVFAQFFTLTIQVIVGAILLFNFIWILMRRTLYEDEAYVLWSIVGIFFIIGLVAGDAWYVYKAQILQSIPNLHIQIFR